MRSSRHFLSLIPAYTDRHRKSVSEPELEKPKTPTAQTVARLSVPSMAHRRDGMLATIG